MHDRVADVSRTAAARLAAELDPRLPREVETELARRNSGIPGELAVDATSLGGLLVSLAALACTICADLGRARKAPTADAVARQVRAILQGRPTLAVLTVTEQEHLIDVVVAEVVRTAP